VETRTCEHVKALHAYLREWQLDIYSEHGEEPQGWVNVHCRRCKKTFEISIRLQEPYGE